MDFTPVCTPLMAGNELKYVAECMETGWISSAGKFVTAFEESFAKYSGAEYGVSVCNGTVALHLALQALNISAGDEVLVPNFTMIASAFAVCYTGAMPVFVEADKETWNMDIEDLKSKITSRTKAIMPVSIFGNPCEMDEILEIARQNKIYIIEDAAESHGAEYKGRKLGSIADVTCFSFFANKNLTTGEGGMVLTNNKEIADKLRYFKNLCFSLDGPRNYLHEDIGFNYRMSNIHAAIGLAQVEKADEYKSMRIANAALYRKYLENVPGIKFQKSMDYVVNVHWMNGIVIDSFEYGKSRDSLMTFLRENGVDSRTFFTGMNEQPSLIKYGCDVDSNKYEVTKWLSKNGFYLPSSSHLEESKIKEICQLIIDFRFK